MKTTTHDIAPLDLTNYFADSSLFPKFYHKCPKTGQERLALGQVLMTTAIPDTRREDPLCTFYGALSFPGKKSVSDLWQDFPSPFFFLPRIEIRQTHDHAHLLLRDLDQLPHVTAPRSRSYPSLRRRSDAPDKNGWVSQVQHTQHRMELPPLEKVVLARKTTYATTRPVLPLSWLRYLLEKCPLTTTYALQISPLSLFTGSSPERLFHRMGQELKTEAIAGTRPLGRSLAEDATLAQELRTSSKDIQEVGLVQKFLQLRLPLLCRDISEDAECSIVKTDTVQHLYRGFRGHLLPENHDKEILSLLHPTPAVCGFPAHEALDCIHSTESFDRGLYSGAIGWTCRDEGSFTVAIRSGLVRDGLFHAFSGAGIVAGSNPESEWTELEHKIAHWNNLC